ncbi:MAG: M60 family metallopeptidase [Roseburia sp.]|nr:M60 family metallopeptidase [Anaeroplasma bactoclasticum]MCM1196739.1 M60 family metallopeptidase [Roseburia sp.]MCM1557494.1 M60 family metallopeptidase [Anaeroplasma bactoclasticum]
MATKKENSQVKINKEKENKLVKKEVTKATRSNQEQQKPKSVKTNQQKLSSISNKAEDKEVSSKVKQNSQPNKEKKFEKRKIIIIAAISVLCIFVLIIGLVFGLRGSNKTPSYTFNQGTATEITNGYETGTTKAMQTAEYLGTVKREIPEDVKDEREVYGVKEYPTYGKALKHTASEFEAVKNESRALTPYPTWKSLNIYDALDEQGYLLRNGEKVVDENGAYRKLYKHSASIGMYGGDVADDEPAIIKKISFISRAGLASNQITGIYAPAGEVLKIELTEEDLKETGGLRVYIGQNYNLDQQVSMEWTSSGVKGNGFTRMSDILNIFEVKSTVAYVGSFIGGPVYVRPIKNSTSHNFSVTISGGVRYQHFILGVTTEEEYELNKASSAPYFDLEVYDEAVRFTTTKHTGSGGHYLRDYTYEDCTDAAVLWDKISQVSKSVEKNGLSSTSVPVMIIGDCYIAAGAAFANPGRNGVVCPPSWLAGALNYKAFVDGGSWGTMHEYNHCWQGYGVGNGGEVTNNATTLISYTLYTRISANRTIGGGVSGWNRFTDPGKSVGENLNIVRDGTTKSFDLSLYATLLHNIGQEYFIQAAHGGREAGSTIYYNNLVEATHLDMTYYFTDVLHFEVVDDISQTKKGYLKKSIVDEIKARKYPVFVPVSSTYQIGRSITKADGSKEYITTAQPFQYTGSSLTMNFANQNNFKDNSYLSTELVLPDGIDVRVKAVTQPENGKVELLENNMVKYTKSETGGAISGQFIVTLELIKKDNAFKIDDVDLVINLQQKSSLERTTYTYETITDVPNISTLYQPLTNSFDFANYNWTEKINNVCPMESSCQIWAGGINYYDDVYDKNSTNKKDLPLGQTLQLLEGVIYLPKAGDYRFALKGRGEVALYLSFDKGKTWDLAVSIDRPGTDKAGFIEGNWKDYTLTDEMTHVYFKAILKVKNNASDYFGIGYASEQTDEEGAGLGYFSELTNANGYRNEEYYELDHAKFETKYFFPKVYKYDYNDKILATDHKLISINKEAWDNSFSTDNLFDGNTNTNYLSDKKNFVTENSPIELEVDMGKIITANSVTFYGFNAKANGVGNLGMPHSFKLYGSLDGENYTLIIERENATNTTKNVTFTFEEVSLQYYKLIVTKTDNQKYFGMNKIEFALSFPNGITIAPNDEKVLYTGENWNSENVLCSFGRIYTGKASDYVEIKFNGTRFAYFAYKDTHYGTVNIYIDGRLVAEKVSLNGDRSPMSVIYLSELLSLSDHIVKIVGQDGTFNVDSFVYWEK